MKNLAIFISGSGSNMKNIVQNIETGKISDAKVELILASKESAGGLEFAKQKGLSNEVFLYKGLDESEISDCLLDILKKHEIDMIILAGFMKVIPEKVVKEYEGRILNIHPSLIPKHCGKGYYGMRVHESVIAAGDKISGATVHYVDAGVDTGKIILQESCEVLPDDTPETLQKRVLKIEHKIYSEAIEKVL